LPYNAYLERIMEKNDYDDPVIEEKWCSERREQVEDYLSREKVTHGQVGEWPAWHVAPYVSIWAVESAFRNDRLGWWVICGDLPTDYVSAIDLKNPRDALRAIVTRWFDVAEYMIRGEAHPSILVGEKTSWPELGPLLESRAKVLEKWAEDDLLWDNAL
jgi:hypothetical protein